MYRKEVNIIIQDTIKFWLKYEEERSLKTISKSTSITERTLSNYLNDETSRSTLVCQERMIYASGRCILLPHFRDLLLNDKIYKYLVDNGHNPQALKLLLTNDILKYYKQIELDAICTDITNFLVEGSNI